MTKQTTVFILAAMLVVLFACKKDKQPAPALTRDQFIGTYSGTQTTLLSADGDDVSYEEVAVTKTIEEGIAESDIIIGKGTTLEMKASIDGAGFFIPGQTLPVKFEKLGLTINISLLGQGVLSTSKGLTVNYGGTESVDGTLYKLTIVEKLTKVKVP